MQVSCDCAALDKEEEAPKKGCLGTEFGDWKFVVHDQGLGLGVVPAFNFLWHKRHIVSGLVVKCSGVESCFCNK